MYNGFKSMNETNLILQGTSPWKVRRKRGKTMTDQTENKAKKKRKQQKHRKKNSGKRLSKTKKRQGSKQTYNKKRVFGQSTTQIADTNVNR